LIARMLWGIFTRTKPPKFKYIHTSDLQKNRLWKWIWRIWIACYGCPNNRDSTVIPRNLEEYLTLSSLIIGQKPEILVFIAQRQLLPYLLCCHECLKMWACLFQPHPCFDQSMLGFSRLQLSMCKWTFWQICGIWASD